MAKFPTMKSFISALRDRMLPMAQTPKQARAQRFKQSPQLQVELSQKKLRAELMGEVSKIRRGILRAEAATREFLPRLKLGLQKAFGWLGIFGTGQQPTATKPVKPSRRYPEIADTTAAGAKMYGVSSSNVYSVGFDAYKGDNGKELDYGELFIQFRNGWLYQYTAAPRWLYDGLRSTPSPGRFVWDQLRRGLFPDGVPHGDLNREGYERIPSMAAAIKRTPPAWVR